MGYLLMEPTAWWVACLPDHSFSGPWCDHTHTASRVTYSVHVSIAWYDCICSSYLSSMCMCYRLGLPSLGYLSYWQYCCHGAWCMSWATSVGRPAGSLAGGNRGLHRCICSWSRYYQLGPLFDIHCAAAAGCCCCCCHPWRALFMRYAILQCLFVRPSVCPMPL